MIVGLMVRQQQEIEGAIEISAEEVCAGLFKIRVRILNLTPFERAQTRSRNEALMRSLVSTHTILGANGGDILDLALAGKVAVIESIEQNYENRIHLAVVLEDDPGRDLGMLRQPGHRFFFTPEEIEPVEQ